MYDELIAIDLFTILRYDLLRYGLVRPADRHFVEVNGMYFHASSIGGIMENVKWLFFDIGSTLIDESECYRLRYREAVVGTTINPTDFEKKVIEFSKQNRKGDHEAARYYGIALPPWHIEAEKPYTDTEYVLNQLSGKGYRLGVIANQSPGTKERLSNWGLLKYFDIVLASAEEGISKPNPEIYHRALIAASCLPDSAVMIGDRLDNDIVPAKRVGMRTVWIRQGLGGLASVVHENEKADYEVRNLSELLALF